MSACGLLVIMSDALALLTPASSGSLCLNCCYWVCFAFIKVIIHFFFICKVHFDMGVNADWLTSGVSLEWPFKELQLLTLILSALGFIASY